MKYCIMRYDPKFPDRPYRVDIGWFHWWLKSDIMKVFNEYAAKMKRYSESHQITWITDKHFQVDGIDYKIELFNNQ